MHDNMTLKSSSAMNGLKLFISVTSRNVRKPIQYMNSKDRGHVDINK